MDVFSLSDAAPHAAQRADSRTLSELAEGMGLGMHEVELDGRRGRSFRLSSDGTGKRQNQKTEAQYRQGLERCSGDKSPIEG